MPDQEHTKTIEYNSRQQQWCEPSISGEKHAKPARTIGNYEVLGQLGRGGMGVVYRAKQIHLKRLVALKVLPTEKIAEENAVHRFYREMEAIGRLHHPNIVEAYDAGQSDQVHYLAMELVNGPSVAELAAESITFRWQDACEIVRQAAAGLLHAHGNELIHRDVKPSNLLAAEDGVIKVSDLGLAKLQDGLQISSLTADDSLLGTVDYMSPEQGLLGGKVGPASDIYSLGCVLYRLLTGQVPFPGPPYSSKLEKLRAHAEAQPIPVRELRADISEQLSQLVGRMLEKVPGQRPSTMGEVAEHLLEFSEASEVAELVRTWKSNEVLASASFGTESQKSQLESTVRVGKSSSSRLSFKIWRRSLVGVVIVITLAFAVASLFKRWHHNEASGPTDTSKRISTRRGLPADAPPNRTDMRHFQDLAPNEVEELRWYKLLENEPVPVIWPEDDGLSSFEFNKRLEQITVSTSGPSFLSLGTAERPGYKIQVDLFQQNWTGNIGIFYGLQKVFNDGKDAWECQLIFLKPFIGPDRQQFPLLAVRAELTAFRRPDGTWSFPMTELGSAKILIPDFSPQMLELTVSQIGKLSTVRWGGQSLDSLCTLKLNNRYEKTSYAGDFGIWCTYSNATFRTARFMYVAQPDSIAK